MFVNPNFTFNGIYSQDMNVSIATFDTNMFNNIGVEYTSDISIENDLVEYNPYYTESFSESSDIELNLVIYDSTTMEAIDIDLVDMEQIMDWLCTENFAPFISDDDRDLIYYFKVVGIQKVLTFNNKGYLKVTFKPYSKYAYRRREYEIEVNGNTSIEIFNHSRTIYCPIIEVTNLGDTSTINKINDMRILGLDTNEKVIIDNLTKIVQADSGINKFNCCNRKWINLKPRVKNTITLGGNCKVKIICEFPLIK